MRRENARTFLRGSAYSLGRWASAFRNLFGTREPHLSPAKATTAMEYVETISKIGLAVLGIWRLTRSAQLAFHHGGAASYGQRAGITLRPEDYLGHRVMDCLYWIAIWMSAQTAIWVACGFAGVLVNWLAFAGVARLVQRSKRTTVPRIKAASTAHATSTKDCNGAAQLCL